MIEYPGRRRVALLKRAQVKHPTANYMVWSQDLVPDGEGVLLGFTSESCDNETNTVALIEKLDGTFETRFVNHIKLL